MMVPSSPSLFKKYKAFFVRIFFSRMGIVGLVLMTGCLQAPRARLMESPARDRSWKMTSRFAEEAKSAETPSRTFPDTSFVTVAGDNALSLVALLASARKNLDEQQFTLAEEQIRMVLETGDDRDSLTDESRFLLGELFVVQNKFVEAQRQFATILKMPSLTTSVRERSMIRLGHVFCAIGKTEDARKVFKQFVREFPESSYTSLANCAAVGR